MRHFSFPSFSFRFVLVSCFCAPSRHPLAQQPSPRNSTASTTSTASAPADPAWALWLSVKKELSGPNGREYFESMMKDRHLPDAASGVEHFKGIVISSKPTARPSELFWRCRTGRRRKLP